MFIDTRYLLVVTNLQTIHNVHPKLSLLKSYFRIRINCQMKTVSEHLVGNE